MKEVLPDATAATRFPKQVAWCLAKRPGEELYEVGTDPRQVKNMAEDARYAGQREAARTRKTHKPE